MTRQFVRRENQSPKKDADKSILQRTAVRSLPQKPVTPQVQRESPAGDRPGIKVDLMQIPLSNHKTPVVQPKLMVGKESETDRQQEGPEFRGLSSEVISEREVRQSDRSTPVQRQEAEKKAENKTGLPDRLMEGIESMSGYDLSEVRVNYNSPKPPQVNALAYTQGQAIEVASGQERHLPHEAWHVVQQMQGRVRPTMEVNGVGVNGDRGLEREADMMGQKALQMRSTTKSRPSVSRPGKTLITQLMLNDELLQQYKTDYVGIDEKLLSEVFKRVKNQCDTIEKGLRLAHQLIVDQLLKLVIPEYDQEYPKIYNNLIRQDPQNLKESWDNTVARRNAIIIKDRNYVSISEANLSFAKDMVQHHNPKNARPFFTTYENRDQLKSLYGETYSQNEFELNTSGYPVIHQVDLSEPETYKFMESMEDESMFRFNGPRVTRGTKGYSNKKLINDFANLPKALGKSEAQLVINVPKEEAYDNKDTRNRLYGLNTVFKDKKLKMEYATEGIESRYMGYEHKQNTKDAKALVADNTVEYTLRYEQDMEPLGAYKLEKLPLRKNSIEDLDELELDIYGHSLYRRDVRQEVIKIYEEVHPLDKRVEDYETLIEEYLKKNTNLYELFQDFSLSHFWFDKDSILNNLNELVSRIKSNLS